LAASKTPPHLDAMVILNLGAMVPADGDHSHTVGNVVMKPTKKKKVRSQLGQQKKKQKSHVKPVAVHIAHGVASVELITSSVTKWAQDSRYMHGYLPHFDLGGFIDGLVTIARTTCTNATPVIWPSFFCIAEKATQAASVMCNTESTPANVKPAEWDLSDADLNLPAVYVEEDLEEPTIACSKTFIEEVCTKNTLVPTSLVVATTVIFAKNLTRSPTVLLAETTDEAVKIANQMQIAFSSLAKPPLVCLFANTTRYDIQTRVRISTVLQQNGLVVGVQNKDVLEDVGKAIFAWNTVRINKNTTYTATDGRYRGGYYLIKGSVDGFDTGDSRLPQQSCTVNLKSLTDDEYSTF
jgi:hypothetical protein